MLLFVAYTVRAPRIDDTRHAMNWRLKLVVWTSFLATDRTLLLLGDCPVRIEFGIRYRCLRPGGQATYYIWSWSARSRHRRWKPPLISSPAPHGELDEDADGRGGDREISASTVSTKSHTKLESNNGSRISLNDSYELVITQHTPRGEQVLNPDSLTSKFCGSLTRKVVTSAAGGDQPHHNGSDLPQLFLFY